MYQNKTREYYAGIANHYPDNISGWRIKLLNEYVKKEHRVLDLGCGPGKFFPYVKSIRLHAIDLTPENIALIKDPRVIATVGDITKMLYPNGFFDSAYSFSTMYYVKDQELAIKEISRVMHQGGIVLLEFGNKYCLEHLWDKLMFKVPQFFSSEKTLIKLFNQNGLSVKKILYRQPLPGVDKPTNKWLAFRMIFIVEKVD